MKFEFEAPHYEDSAFDNWIRLPNGPTELQALLAATTWLQMTLLGTIATTITIIFVAPVGLMMLSGRVDFRHGITVVVGCFIIFGVEHRRWDRGGSKRRDRGGRLCAVLKSGTSAGGSGGAANTERPRSFGKWEDMS